MMTRHRLLFFGPFAGLLAMVVGVALLWPHAAISSWNAARIRNGMTLTEVQAILGGPARDESTGRFDDDDEATIGLMQWCHEHCHGVQCQFVPPFSFGQLWISDYALIDVRFDADGKVISAHCFDLDPIPESPLELLRRCLRL